MSDNVRLTAIVLWLFGGLIVTCIVLILRAGWHVHTENVRVEPQPRTDGFLAKHPTFTVFLVLFSTLAIIVSWTAKALRSGVSMRDATLAASPARYWVDIAMMAICAMFVAGAFVRAVAQVVKSIRRAKLQSAQSRG